MELKIIPSDLPLIRCTSYRIYFVYIYYLESDGILYLDDSVHAERVVTHLDANVTAAEPGHQTADVV